jgi:hypothetical protein
METTTCRHCRTFIVSGNPQTCGACGKTRNHGDRIHCFSHCLEFIEAQPEVRRNGDYTTCLERGHEAEAHMEMDQNETPTCGLYSKASGTTCNSIQNAVFHGSTSHNAQNGGTNPQRSVIPQLTLNNCSRNTTKRNSGQQSSTVAAKQVLWENRFAVRVQIRGH